MARINGKKLRAEMKKRGLSYRKLGEMTGLSYSTIYYICHGVIRGKMSTLGLLSQALDMHPCELIKKEYIPRNPEKRKASERKKNRKE